MLMQFDPSLVADGHRQSPAPLTLPLVLALFVGSGCAALIDEIVWFQLLELVIGSTAVSLGLLLGTFMGGMCLGSLIMPRLISERHHPLRVYAMLELGIGALAILVLMGLPYVGHLYATFAGYGRLDIVLRGVLCSVCLLPPAALMGATLPAIARFVEATPRGIAWLGFFYGGNTAGAVAGCLAAGFFLLRVYDLATAAYVAVAINVAVALTALALARRSPRRVAAGETRANPVAPTGGAWAVYLAVALSGMSALGAEVVWTRLLSLLLAGTTYTFSIILAVFLGGIGAGSSVAARESFFSRRPRLALGTCQLLLVPAMAWAAWALGSGLYSLRIDPATIENLGITMVRDLARCAWAIFPAACLWGASFPLALAALAPPSVDRGRLVGGVYSVNTAGAIVGAIACSLLLIPGVGTQHSQQALMGVAVAAGLCLLLPLAWMQLTRADGGKQLRRTGWVSMTALAAALVGAGLLVESVQPVPFELIAYGRDAYKHLGSGPREVYRGEGLNATIGVSEGDGILQFHVSGKVEASNGLYDLRLERMLANIPAMLHPDMHSVLVVGCGAGVTAGSFLPYGKDLQRLVICEIEPLIPQFVAPYFSKYNMHVVNNPTVEIVYDDARHFLLVTDEKFDIITSDPIHPYVKGAATLYTEEYFELVREHLNPRGLVTQWVPLYESSIETVKTEIATFLKVFPHASVWCNTKNGQGYDLVLLGSTQPLQIDLDALHERMNQPEFRVARNYLEQLGYSSETDLLCAFAVQGADLVPWLTGTEINRDRNLRLQYLAGMLPKYNLMQIICKEMIAYRKYPQNLFTGSAERRAALQEALSTGPYVPSDNWVLH